MKQIFATNVDFNLNESLNFRAENLLSFPASSDTGRIIMHTGLNKFYGYNGVNWLDLGFGSGTPNDSRFVMGALDSDNLTNSVIGAANSQSLINKGFVFSTVPVKGSSTGVQGETAVDSNYLYKCIATNTWVRVGMTSW
jgi:hypothetical protein